MTVSSKQIFTTVAAAYGAYVVGSTAADYNTKSQAFYNGFSNATSYWTQNWTTYCQSVGGIDSAMQACVTHDNIINTQSLVTNGFFDSLRSYLAYGVTDGTVVVGSNSVYIAGTALQIDNKQWAFYDTFPSNINTGYNYPNSEYPYMFGYYSETSGSNTIWHLYYSKFDNITLFRDGNRLYTNSNAIMVVNATFNSYGGRIDSSSAATNFSVYSVDTERANESLRYLNPELTYTVYGYSNSQVTREIIINNVMATVDQSVLDDTASYPTGSISLFTPSSDQLTNGYESTDVISADDVTGKILTIENMLPGLQRYDASFADVAKTGDYDDLINKPDIQDMIDDAMEDIDLSAYATKQYVDDAIDTALGAILNGSY